MPGIDTRPHHILTFDLEEHFQASRFDSPMRRRNWTSFQSRAQASVERILELLALHSTRATFFSLGWLAEQHPGIIRAVSGAGHEIACLGYGHELVAAQTPQLFREDIRRAKGILEDVTGSEVVGFRAPSLSITAHTPWALPIVAKEGFLYDSSVLPILHDLSGIPGSNEWIHRLSWDGQGLWEIPPSTMNVGGFRMAIGGGGYLRAFSYPVLKSLLSRIEALEEPIVVYMRSWEIDAAQPRMRDTVLSEFRHYFNLDKTAGRLNQLLTDFQFGPVCEVVLAIRDQVRNASVRAVLHSDPRDSQQESPLLTTVYPRRIKSQTLTTTQDIQYQPNTPAPARDCPPQNIVNPQLCPTSVLNRSSLTLQESSLRVTTVAFNLIARYPGQFFQSYAGVGAGAFYFSSSNGSIQGRQFRPGLNLLAGTKVRVTDEWGLFAEGKYNLANVSNFDPTFGLSGMYSIFHLVAGVAYHF